MTALPSFFVSFYSSNVAVPLPTASLLLVHSLVLVSAITFSCVPTLPSVRILLLFVISFRRSRSKSVTISERRSCALVATHQINGWHKRQVSFRLFCRRYSIEFSSNPCICACILDIPWIEFLFRPVGRLCSFAYASLQQ